MSAPTQAQSCPKCQFQLPAMAGACPKCGLIFEKLHRVPPRIPVSTDLSDVTAKRSQSNQSAASSTTRTFSMTGPVRMLVGAALLGIVAFAVGRWSTAPPAARIVRAVPPAGSFGAVSTPGAVAGQQKAEPVQQREEPVAPTAEINADIAAVEGDLKRAEEDDGRYSGGLVKALVGSELHTLRQTRAMLQQRAKAWVFRIGLTYTVDGRPFALPDNAPQLLGAVEVEIADTRTKLASAIQEADRYSGGLVQSLSLVTVATTRNTLAMLEQKRLALKYGLPQYVGFRSDETPSASPHASVPLAPTQPAEVRRWSIVEVDSRVTESNDSWWRYAWKLTIRNESSADRSFNATLEFQDADGFVIDSATEYNLSVPAHGDRTFTGYTLVSLPGASRVARTNAKASPRN
jgi:hypothetical protein